MTQALSRDLRERIVGAYLAGGVRQVDVAERYNVSRSVVGKLVQQSRDEGSLDHHLDRCGRKPKLCDEDEEALLDDVRERPDATLAERADKLGPVCSLTTLWETLHRLKQRYPSRRLSLEAQHGSLNTRPSNSGPMLFGPEESGTSASRALTPNA